jgi:hypothetical protein
MTETKTQLQIPGRDRGADMETLATAFIHNLERDTSCYDTWAVDDKRVFGNSNLFLDIIEDVLKIKTNHDGDMPFTIGDGAAALIEADTLEKYAESLWAELGPYIEQEWDKRHERA